MRESASTVHGDAMLERSYWLSGGLWTILADAESTGGRFTVLQERLPRGAGAAPHYHEGQAETFCVLAGTVTFMLGDDIVQVKDSGFVFIPPELKHAFRVDSDEAFVVNQHAPAGFERLVTTFGHPAEALTMPPPGLKNRVVTPEQRIALYADIRQINLDGPNPLAGPKGG